MWSSDSNVVAKAGRPAAVLALVAGTLALGLGGCKSSFLDPTKTGRFEFTPTVMPILDRISSIEESGGELVDYSDPLTEDLIPRPNSYRIGPGDQLQIVVFDIIEPEGREQYEVQVDPRGFIEIPQLGRIDVDDRTTEEATTAIEETIKAKNLIQDPLVQVIAIAQRRQTFTVLGAIQSPGLFPIPRADYRVLEALSAAGSFDESTSEIYVIRQVPLADEVVTGRGVNREGSTPVLQNRPVDNQPKQPAPSSEDLLKIIDDIAPEKEVPSAPPAPARPPGAPGAMRSGDGSAQRAAVRAVAQPSMMQPDPASPPEQPLIDLIEEQDSSTPQLADGSRWIFVNGKWVSVKAATDQEAAALGTKPDELITQRVIRIKLKELLAGKQSINIVVRPGDVIRFPAAGSGFVYMSGEFARPGPYQVVPGLTLLRAVSSAGGYNEIATPWRVDLTRRVGENRQATIRLDLQAIDARTQPDILLKPDDIVSVGTNFWALPLAVTRNGFRMSYGFGFILDRNLSNDLFGPPPVNNFGQ